MEQRAEPEHQAEIDRDQERSEERVDDAPLDQDLGVEHSMPERGVGECRGQEEEREHREAQGRGRGREEDREEDGDHDRRQTEHRADQRRAQARALPRLPGALEGANEERHRQCGIDDEIDGGEIPVERFVMERLPAGGRPAEHWILNHEHDECCRQVQEQLEPPAARGRAGREEQEEVHGERRQEQREGVVEDLVAEPDPAHVEDRRLAQERERNRVADGEKKTRSGALQRWKAIRNPIASEERQTRGGEHEAEEHFVHRRPRADQLPHGGLAHRVRRRTGGERFADAGVPDFDPALGDGRVGNAVRGQNPVAGVNAGGRRRTCRDPT